MTEEKFIAHRPNTKNISVLGRFLIISLPLCLFVFVIYVIIFQNLKSQDAHDQLKQKLEMLTATYSLLLTAPLLENNLEVIDLQTIALLSDPDISKLEIKDDTGAIIQQSGEDNFLKPTVYEQSIPITYLIGPNSIVVGELTIGVNDQNIKSNTNRSLLNDLLLLGILLCTIAIGIYAAYVHAVGKPLNLLVKSLTHYRENRRHSFIQYENKDEFGKLIDAYNRMHENQRVQSKEIEQYQAKLELEIVETKSLQVKLEYEASHDSLTNLYNRRTFDRKLTIALDTVKKNNGKGAVISMDLDRFKIVNDTCGHRAGDALLKELSGTLQALVKGKAIMARLGGDEFSMLVENSSLNDAYAIADNILKTVEEYGFSWDGKYFEIGISIGLVPFNKKTTGVHELMSMADAACYEAKEQGRNRIQIYRVNDVGLADKFFQSEMVSIITESLKLNRFELWSQPLIKINQSNNTPAKEFSYIEILIRMRDAEGNLISPASFLPSAERFGLANRIDIWVVKTIFEYFNLNNNVITKIDRCFINLSGLSVGNENFLELIIELCTSAKFPLSKICFEVTETAAIVNMSKAKKFISTLQKMKIKFALDDFGSGMSSFEYIKNLPVDVLKIDGSYIREIVNNPKVTSIVEAMIQMGKILGKEVVAEFVENELIYQKLATMQIDYAQGYYLGKPEPYILKEDNR